MGKEDVHVPIIHGSTMVAAMTKAGNPIDCVEYAGGGHGFNKSENVNDFYSRMERFLAEHLKKQ